VRARRRDRQSHLLHAHREVTHKGIELQALGQITRNGRSTPATPISIPKYRTMQTPQLSARLNCFFQADGSLATTYSLSEGV